MSDVIICTHFCYPGQIGPSICFGRVMPTRFWSVRWPAFLKSTFTEQTA